MGDIILLFAVMLTMAAIVFAPLGYFIYKYQSGAPQPFGDTEPHGDSPSAINDFAEAVIGWVSGLFGKKPS